jgi:oligo-1,6-glucosidase
MKKPFRIRNLLTGFRNIFAEEDTMQKLTMESRLKEVWENPIGHDILAKVLMQAGIPEKVITNPLVSSLKLKAVAPLTKNLLDEDFWKAFLHLVNSETDRPEPDTKKIVPRWWKEAVFYQIYPRTFMDSNGDGIGDLRGITSKLDYLKDLGIDCIWLSPIYDSPMADNGYDIRDYRKINEEFGTMEDFDEMLAGIHARGMKLIMDLVVNHTSDEHAWFQEAISSKDNDKRDYYFLQEEDGSGKAPNNWTSFFSGSAWSQYGDNHDWVLHLFTKKQIDLNWDNPKVRKGVSDMVSWWLEKGVDGFRLDVINYISKEKGLPDGDVSVGNLMGYTGIEHYYYGPHLHEYLHELHENSFAKYNAFSIGETPGLGMKMCQLITGENRKELDMVFSFDHLETPGHVRWDDYRYDLNYFRDYMIDWMEHYGSHCWMSLFYNNHDNPRMVSKINPDPAYRRAIEELLAVLQMTLKGTPFLFQGDEMGLTNYDFHDISELNDVESINYYKELMEKGKSPQEAWKTVLAGSRDHARMLLPWNHADLPEYLKQEADPRITTVYKDLIALRKAHPALIYGNFQVLDSRKDRFVYTRSDEQEEFLIDANLSTKQRYGHHVSSDYELIWPKTLHGTDLDAYGVRIWKKRLH